jgi:hypothetical protein
VWVVSPQRKEARLQHDEVGARTRAAASLLRERQAEEQVRELEGRGDPTRLRSLSLSLSHLSRELPTDVEQRADNFLLTRVCM